MKLISILTPTFNEEGNVKALSNAVKDVLKELPDYNYEHIFIDNASTDDTVKILKEIAERDKRVKVIVNVKNFGHIRSPYYGVLQTTGDAVITMASDLQDPPEMIKTFIKKWEEGYKIVIGIKKKSAENPFIFIIRRLFYWLIDKISETDYIRNFTGFGLYDKSFINILRRLDDPYPYFRGLVAQFGSDFCKVEYSQPKRVKGESSNNFYTLYDLAMLGFVNHSKMPIRLASLVGFLGASLSFVVGFIYLIFKLIHWNEFSAGIAPLVIGFFFFASMQLFFIGIIGEYIGSIYTQVKNHPLVIEKERINFD